MRRGYTKRWRKRWDKGYHKDPLLWIVMDYFIDFATWQDKEVFEKGIGIIPLKRGQWYFTYRGLAKYLFTSVQSMRTCMSRLVKLQFLTLEPTHQYTTVTVINYDTYQPTENEINTHSNTDLTQSQHSPNTLLYNTKKVKNIKKDNIYSSCFLKFWEKYPKKQNKGGAWRAWKKIKKPTDLLPTLLAAIENQKGSDGWLKENGQFIPHPATWLNGRRWEDEATETASYDYKKWDEVLKENKEFERNLKKTD